jgi:hypothetical protein
MNITFEDIRKANESIKTTMIEGNDYAKVNQRIKAFRMVYPTGAILTDMAKNENGVCVFTAACGYYNNDGTFITLGTGTACERENSTFINETSYIENCETSAVGRALGMCGFGIDTSVASAEEVRNATQNQNDPVKDTPSDDRKATPKQIEVLAKTFTGENMTKLLKAYGVERIEDISMSKASELIGKLKKKEVQNNG